MMHLLSTLGGDGVSSRPVVVIVNMGVKEDQAGRCHIEDQYSPGPNPILAAAHILAGFW